MIIYHVKSNIKNNNLIKFYYFRYGIGINFALMLRAFLFNVSNKIGINFVLPNKGKHEFMGTKGIMEDWVEITNTLSRLLILTRFKLVFIKLRIRFKGEVNSNIFDIVPFITIENKKKRILTTTIKSSKSIGFIIGKRKNKGNLIKDGKLKINSIINIIKSINFKLIKKREGEIIYFLIKWRREINGEILLIKTIKKFLNEINLINIRKLRIMKVSKRSLLLITNIPIEKLINKSKGNNTFKWIHQLFYVKNNWLILKRIDKINEINKIREFLDKMLSKINE